MSDSIVIVEYDPRWPVEFSRLRDRAALALGDLAVAIDTLARQRSLDSRPSR